ncbi:MAG: 50S ribosomal protein L18 [Patescibacteria group bacterium]|jgi:large subunit ribosomal protein L18
MDKQKLNTIKRRITPKVKGDKAQPRLAVYKSSKHIYAQVIDDSIGKTSVSASDVKIEKKSKSQRADLVGQMIAEVALKNKIKKVRFDRSGFQYHGRIKQLAESAKAHGLEF